MVKVYELMNKGIDPVQYCLDKIEELGAEEEPVEEVEETPTPTPTNNNTPTSEAGSGSGTDAGGD